MEYLSIYILVGAGAGFVAGLLGVGGGLIIVPVLVFAFAAQGFAPSVLVHLAIGTSLATIVVTSIASVRTHHRHGAVQWKVFRELTPGIVIGALGGAAIANVLPGEKLRAIFGVFELLVALQMGMGWRVSAHRNLPGAMALSGAGVVIGAISSVIGIGGGTLTVPYLSWCNVGLRQAIATSAATGFPIAMAGAMGFVATGWDVPLLPPLSGGYVYWPAFAAISAVSLLFAPLGAKLTHRLPVVVLRRVFAVLLAILGVRMLLAG